MMPRDNVLTPEEIRALLQGPGDAEQQESPELLRELVHLVLTAVIQQPALGLPPAWRLQMDDAVPESFDAWWTRAQEAPAWAGLQLQGGLEGLLTAILLQPPPGMAAGFLSPMLGGLLREFAARLQRWLLGEGPVSVAPWSGPQESSPGPEAGAEGAGDVVHWSLPCRVEAEGGTWTLEIGLSQGLGQTVLAILGHQPGTSPAREGLISATGGAEGLQAPDAPRPGEMTATTGSRQEPPEPLVRPARFPPLGPEAPEPEESEPPDLLDLPLRVTVELGRTRLPIQRIMELEPGVTIELDRLAGEMVDVLVNGRLIAKGEVVVVDDAFGVKITDILSPVERMRGLG